MPFKPEKSGQFTVLGRLVEQFEDRIAVSQHEYLKNIKNISVKRERERSWSSNWLGLPAALAHSWHMM